jgi:hypothetical protein
MDVRTELDPEWVGSGRPTSFRRGAAQALRGAREAKVVAEQAQPRLGSRSLRSPWSPPLAPIPGRPASTGARLQDPALRRTRKGEPRLGADAKLVLRRRVAWIEAWPRGRRMLVGRRQGIDPSPTPTPGLGPSGSPIPSRDRSLALRARLQSCTGFLLHAIHRPLRLRTRSPRT